MTPATWLDADCAVGIVDRIEDDVAVVEWCPAFVVDVPLIALPAGVSEGDRVVLALPLRPPSRSVDAPVDRAAVDGHPGAPPRVEQESLHASP